MNLHTISNNLYSKMSTQAWSSKVLENKKTTHQSLKNTDVVEISSEAYQLQSDNEKLTAISGKDSLGITKGSKDNTFVIHFSDSAMVSRTIARGYLTVNGTRIDLSDEVKNQLTEIDMQAQTDREIAFSKYIMQHNMAVAQQQSEVYKGVAEDMSKAFKIAAIISNGGKVSSTDQKALMEFSPQLYAMAKMAAIMAARHEKQKDYTEETISNTEDLNDVDQGVEGTSIERKYYETQMNVSLTGGTAEVQGVAEKEIVVNA